MKKCFKCNEIKPLTDFYAQPKMSDGRVNKCKACTCDDVRKNRRMKFEYYSEYEKHRYELNERRRKKLAETSRAWRDKNPEAYKAHNKVNNAVRDGRLKKENCLFCGSDEKIHAHHNDYSKPLEVIWLCTKCHHRMHAYFPQVHGHTDDTSSTQSQHIQIGKV